MKKKDLKKYQHIIPRCYLKNFLTKEIPEEHLNNQKYISPLYIKKANSDWKTEGIGRKSIFTKKFYYDLDFQGIKDEEQYLENFFNKFENEYNLILDSISTDFNNIENKKNYKLTIENLNFDNEKQNSLISFVCLLITRNNNYQDLIKKHIKLNNKIEENDLNKELISNIAKKSIFNTDLKKYFLENKFTIIQNNSNLPFISSDNPYCCIYNSIFYIPLSPNLCIKIPHCNDNLYMVINKEEEINSINKGIYNNSNEFIISNIKYPENNLIEKPTKYTLIILYTKVKKYIIYPNNFKQIKNGFRIYLDKENIDIKKIINEELLRIEWFKKSGESGMMNKIEITQINNEKEYFFDINSVYNF